MIETIPISQIKKGDIIIIPGIEYDNQVLIVSVEKIDRYNDLIIPAELGGLDYAPEDPDHIVRVGHISDKPIITPLNTDLSLSFTAAWRDKLLNHK
jgi:hypothetical protein